MDTLNYNSHSATRKKIVEQKFHNESFNFDCVVFFSGWDISYNDGPMWNANSIRTVHINERSFAIGNQDGLWTSTQQHSSVRARTTVWKSFLK